MSNTNSNRTIEENNQAIEEAIGDVELTDAEIDEAAGGVRRAASGRTSKSSYTFICHGPACCVAGG